MIPKSLLTILCTPLLLLVGLLSTITELKFLPDGSIVELMGLSIFLDLITGLLKSWRKGIVTSSQGFKDTVIKILVYCSCIIAIWILLCIVSQTGISFMIPAVKVLNGVVAFITFTELYSIFENIDAAYPNSAFNQYLIAPILKLLKGKLSKNPITEALDKEPS